MEQEIKPQLNAIPQLTPVWSNNIQSWFFYVENEFSLFKILDQRTRFQVVLRSLTRELFDEVTTTMVDQSTPNPYDLWKEALIKRLALTDRQRADELFRDIELGDHKPTQLLRRMRQLLNGQPLGDSFFRQLFLQRLPQQVQTALAACQSATLEELAETADAVIETFGPRVSSLQATTSQSTQGAFVPLEAFNKLFSEVMHIREELRQRSRSRTRYRSGSRDRYASRSNSRDPDICWYHYTFGNKARTCRSPCKFNNRSDNHQGN